MKLIDVVQQRVGLGAHMGWAKLYCCDLQVVQDALRDGLLQIMLAEAAQQVGVIERGRLLMESTGLTELIVRSADEETRLVHMEVYRCYLTLPLCVVYVTGATPHGVRELSRWLGEHAIVSGGAASFGTYRALLARQARSTVEAWHSHNWRATLHIDDEMEDYRWVMDCEQVEEMMQAAQSAVSGS